MDSDDEPPDSLLAAVARIPPREPGDVSPALADTLPRGGELPAEVSTYGRYQIVRRLGTGGMGIVLEAIDPELGRHVAIKVIRRQHGSAGDHLIERLRREAQALAKLSHPNVVVVHDVGLADTELYVVMQLVAGMTLADHLAAAPRTLGDILELFVAAGRGLAAAHAAGIVHRDFKPTNVLVGRDGDVRVSDFGLARDVVSTEPLDPGAPDVGGRGGLTEPGAAPGTPRYMAPEQRKGAPADARMDVFAFAVSLHEALTGAGLRAGPSLADLDERVRDGDRPPGPARGTIPRWLERILARGAAREPGQRFATAGELVVAVERGRHTQRRRWIGAGAASTALAVGITLALVRDKSQVNPCTRSGDEAAAVWTVGARASLARTLAGDPAASRNVADALDHRIAAWEGMRVEACEATKVRGSQSDALLDRRNACLDRRLDEVRALLARASEPGPRDLARVVRSVDTLAPLATCADTRALLARVPPPEDLAVRRRVDELERTLDDAWALEHLGRYDAALAAAGPLRDAAHAAGYLPLEAETLALLSALHQDKGEAGPAETLLREMVTVAARAKDDVQLADAYAALLNAIGGDAGARSKEALQLIPVAEAAALRASDPRSTIKVMRNSAIVFQRDHQLDEAARRYERVLALQREAFPDDLLGLAKTYGNLCTLEEDRGEHERALASCTHAVDTWRRVRGPDDPASASIVVDLATVDMNLGKYVEARALLDQASTLAERAGQFDMAVVALINVSELDRVAHHSDRAIAVLARAHALIEAKFGPTHPFMAAERMLTGRNLVVAGRLDEAEQALQASLALVEPGDPEVALRLQSLGEIQRLRHRPAEAIPLLERALRIANTATPDVRGAIELELARSLRAAGKDARATDLGRQARASLTAAGVGSKDQLSEAEAFLAVGRR